MQAHELTHALNNHDVSRFKVVALSRSRMSLYDQNEFACAAKSGRHEDGDLNRNSSNDANQAIVTQK